MNFFAWRFGKQGATACDESLAEHDKKYHPNGFDPEHETCNKRAELAKADKGDVLSLSEGAEKGGDKPLVSAAEDAAYMDAVKRGDMKTAAKMVREVAGRAFPDTKITDKKGRPKIVFHGSPYVFTEFGRKDKSNSMYHMFLNGLFCFTDDEDAAEEWSYGKEQNCSGGGDFSKVERMVSDKKEFLNFIDIYKKTRGQLPEDIKYRAFHTNRIFKGVEEAQSKTKELAEKGEFDYNDNPVLRTREMILDAINQYINGDVHEKEIKGKVYRVYLNVKHPNEVNGDKVSPTSKWQDDFEGMDGMIIHNSDIGNAFATEYIVDNPRQIKSADPVTYDDEGNVIPLSSRFDDGDDIRGDVSGGAKKA